MNEKALITAILMSNLIRPGTIHNFKTDKGRQEYVDHCKKIAEVIIKSTESF